MKEGDRQRKRRVGTHGGGGSLDLGDNCVELGLVRLAVGEVRSARGGSRESEPLLLDQGCRSLKTATLVTSSPHPTTTIITHKILRALPIRSPTRVLPSQVLQGHKTNRQHEAVIVNPNEEQRPKTVSKRRHPPRRPPQRCTRSERWQAEATQPGERRKVNSPLRGTNLHEPCCRCREGQQGECNRCTPGHGGWLLARILVGPASTRLCRL